MPIICFGEQYYYSDGNNITPPANTAVVTATNNINNELGRSLMDETFPQNQQIYSLNYRIKRLQSLSLAQKNLLLFHWSYSLAM